jgi:hypothetical protein
MAEIDETMLIAWVDGELGEAEAAQVAQATAADPELAAQAHRHRRMKARFAAAFDPIAEQSVANPTPAPVISLAAVRAERKAKTARPPQRWWRVGGALAASLMVGVLIGHDVRGPSGVADRTGDLALSAPIVQALDGQLSGDGGAVQVALSFKDRGGHYCRSFSGQNLSGVACRDGSDWQLRYASPASSQQTDYRMAGSDDGEMRFIQSTMAGEPLNHDAELKARANRWVR